MKTWRLKGDLTEVNFDTMFKAYSIVGSEMGTQSELPYDLKWLSSKVYIADGEILTLILPDTFFAKFDR